MNRQILFLASCIALIATAMSFAVRGNILADLEDQFVIPYVAGQSGVDLASEEISEEDLKLVGTRSGYIVGAAFWSFGLLILFGGPLVDLFGMGNLLRLAALCHIGGTLMTIFAAKLGMIADPFWIIVLATFVVGAGNGLVEAVCNPLIATIYPDEKAHKLTIFHAWFPGGIVIGGVLAYIFAKMGWNWQLQMALLLIPSVVYTFMIFGQKFPATERVASGLTFGDMIMGAVSRPLFWVLFLMMWLTAATELGPGGWIAKIFEDVTGLKEGILLLVWGNLIMFVLRQFFSKPAHALSPPLLIGVTAPFAAVGLFLFYWAGTSQSSMLFFIAATLMYVGVAYWWPAMLGIVSERCPESGALGLAVIGAVGSFSTAGAGPVIGFLNDKFGPERSLQIWAALPAVIFVVFLLMYFSDKSRGGYKAVKLATLEEAAEAAGDEPLRPQSE